MKLIINQKMISIGNKFQITDERGLPLFLAGEGFLTFTRQCDLFDLGGHLIYHIQKRYFRPYGRYDIMAGDKQVGMLRGRIHWPYVKRFRYTSDKGSFYIKADWFRLKTFMVDENFKIVNKDQPVAQIVKKVRIGDVYTVDFDETKMDPATAASIGICYDIIFHSANSNKIFNVSSH